MPTFGLQFPPSEIGALASRFGFADDARLLAIGADAKARGYYARAEFVEVCAWKTPRSRPQVATNAEPAVIDATRRTLATDDEEKRIGEHPNARQGALTALEGARESVTEAAAVLLAPRVGRR